MKNLVGHTLLLLWCICTMTRAAGWAFFMDMTLMIFVASSTSLRSGFLSAITRQANASFTAALRKSPLLNTSPWRYSTCVKLRFNNASISRSGSSLRNNIQRSCSRPVFQLDLLAYKNDAQITGVIITVEKILQKSVGSGVGYMAADDDMAENSVEIVLQSNAAIWDCHTVFRPLFWRLLRIYTERWAYQRYLELKRRTSPEMIRNDFETAHADRATICTVKLKHTFSHLSSQALKTDGPIISLGVFKEQATEVQIIWFQMPLFLPFCCFLAQ